MNRYPIPPVSVRTAIYARVSSDRQAQEQTIASQVADLERRVKDDGLTLDEELRFIDNGHSGSTLLRPALERLRDMAAAGAFQRLYVHSPDRLARNYAYQVLLVDEFKRAGVELAFYNHVLSDSPEDALLLQVQGVVAEYERAKIMERSRRGRLHAARNGQVSVLSTAPYGYRYVPRQDRGQSARYEVYLPEAHVVRQIFQWVAVERLTLSQVQGRLRQQDNCSARGHAWWGVGMLARLLGNPAYRGSAVFGKTWRGECKPRQHPRRGQAEVRRCAFSSYRTPREQWLPIPVPAIIDEAVFDAAQEQLEHGRRRVRQRRKGKPYLLQGLLVCKQCGYAFHGTAGNFRRSGYYYCGGHAASRFADKQSRCGTTSLKMDPTDAAVWEDVKCLLEDPQRLEQEYARRLEEPDKSKHDSLQGQLHRMILWQQRAISRLIDAFSEGLLQKQEIEPRLQGARERLAQLERQLQEQQNREQQQRELRLVIGQLQTFADRVKHRLQEADQNLRREVILALIRQIDVEADHLTIVYRVPETVTPLRAGNDNVQHCHSRRGAVA